MQKVATTKVVIAIIVAVYHGLLEEAEEETLVMDDSREWRVGWVRDDRLRTMDDSCRLVSLRWWQLSASVASLPITAYEPVKSTTAGVTSKDNERQNHLQGKASACVLQNNNSSTSTSTSSQQPYTSSLFC